MASISTADFKNGMCIINNGKMCTIVEFQHVKPGKGGAFVRTKLKDIKTGRVVDYTFNAGTKFDSVRLESKKMQYLYNDGADFNFMDNDTFHRVVTIIACTSIVITAVYILRVVGKILYGTCDNPEHLKLSDATWDERLSVVCLVVAIAGMGLAPLWVSDMIRGSVAEIIAHILS